MRILLYAWAAPASAIGCCIAIFALCLGATWCIVGGVVEIGGGQICIPGALAATWNTL